jgi:hypothetical protein
MVPERYRVPVAIDGRVPNVENSQACAPACADIRSPEEKNIAAKISSACLACEPASANTLHAREQPMLAERPSMNASPVRLGSCASSLRDAYHRGRTERAAVMKDHAPEATLLIKYLQNKMNYCLLWNSSKLSSAHKAETPKNQSRRSNMLSHPRKLLSSSMDGTGKIFYHPARSTQQHIRHDGLSGQSEMRTGLLGSPLVAVPIASQR